MTEGNVIYNAAEKTKQGNSLCWICLSPAAVRVQGNSYVCHDHAQGKGRLYLEGDTND